MSTVDQFHSIFRSIWLSRLHEQLNHDFCPSANRWVYWLKNPFWIMLAGTMTAVLCGVFVSPFVLAFGAGLGSLLFLGVSFPWLCIQGIRGQIRFLQSRGRPDQPVTVEIELTNRWPWPVWGLELSRGFCGSDEEPSGGLALAYLGGWSTSRVLWSFVPSSRGVYPQESPHIESGFPFGIYRAGRPIEVQNKLIVWPRSTMLDVLPNIADRDSQSDRMSDRRAGALGDLLGTRMFRQGDSLRRVHWAQSARQGRLIVTERQMPVSCELRVSLDLEPHGQLATGFRNSLESLLTVASSLLESLHREHALIECVVGNEIYRIGSAHADLKRCLDGLARVPATGLITDSSKIASATPPSRQTPAEIVLTTASGYAAWRCRSRLAARARFIVLQSGCVTQRSIGSSSEHDLHRPWLELPALANRDLLTDLPKFWRKACYVN